ncbi:GAF domain-containing protein [Pseudonocardia petroleophila]|uniref:GAF domain-containing protein n=1 Tax=Pseudonocardia petroleophila TaxID=37331 RepID=A0A7G7MIM5_9PSEU|nr:GAF domain-containing protein [Pseudonocardia petroleophila]QNG52636.1 GAF domain-containing protein [Pseudonocardia petroleophila]
MTAESDWVQLLAGQAPLDALEAHRRALVAAGTPPERADAQARAALEVAALLAERRQRAVELAALNDVAERLAVVLDPEDLLREVVAQARRLLGVDLTYLALVEGDDRAMRIVVADGARSPRLVGVRLPSGGGLIGRVVDSGEAMWTRDYRTETRIEHAETADRAADAEGLRGLLGVPLAVRGRVLGALLAAKRRERVFDDDEVRLLQGLAAHAAVAIDNARSRQRLAESEAALQRTLALDAELTAAVLEGGDLDSLLERVRAMTPTPLQWLDPDDARRPREGAARPVVAAGDLLGALAVDDPDPDPDVVLLMERAAPVLALTLTGRRAAERADRLGRDIATVDLLTRAEPDPAAERRRLRGAGLDPRREHLVLVADGDPEAARRWAAGLPGAVAALRGRMVMVLPDGVDLHETWTRPGAPTAGLAGPVPASELRRAYADAGRTARALTALGRDGELARAGDLGVFAVLLSHSGRRDLAEQVRRELGRVLAEEQVRQVPLVDTLRTYLEHGRRPTPSAAALGIHVNTLYQRLATIDRLLGDGWQKRALDLHVLLVLHAASGRLDG